jgi:hypothetical protein
LNCKKKKSHHCTGGVPTIKKEFWIILSGYIPEHYLPKATTLISNVMFVWEVNVSFVDFGEIADHHCLSFFFIIWNMPTKISHNIAKGWKIRNINTDNWISRWTVDNRFKYWIIRWKNLKILQIPIVFLCTSFTFPKEFWIILSGYIPEHYLPKATTLISNVMFVFSCFFFGCIVDNNSY